jgi:hypothetical protein
MLKFLMFLSKIHVNSGSAWNRGCRGGRISQKAPDSMRMQQPSPPTSPPSILLLEFGKIPPDLIKSGELKKLVNVRDNGRGPLLFVDMWHRPSSDQIVSTSGRQTCHVTWKQWLMGFNLLRQRRMGCEG